MQKNRFLTIETLPPDLTPDRLPSSFFERPFSVLLESSIGGRYSIAAADPVTVIVSKEGVCFFEVLKKALRENPLVDAPDLPFAGGWIGYLGYELYSEIEKKVPPRKTELIPKGIFCRYDSFYLYDHQEKKAFLAGLTAESENSLQGPAKLAGFMERLCSGPRLPAAKSFRSDDGSNRSSVPFTSSPTPPPSATASNFSKAKYLESIRRIKDYITAGDCYQVNLSQRFHVPVAEGGEALYRRLRAVSPAPYSAFLNLGDAQILSSSPESFLRIDGRRVTTRPIKGTRPRGSTPAEDACLKEELQTSEKDHAELLMITDLERNDLGRVCRPGSVHVSQLAEVESYPQVHHLVSTIEGEIDEGRDTIDLLHAVFPGGSITGAPKIRAMQIIRELEPHARDIYCGAIGTIGLNGKSQFNIAIRTMVVKDKEATFWSGGGIVADSDPEQEYEETLVKAKGMIGALRS